MNKITVNIDYFCLNYIQFSVSPWAITLLKENVFIWVNDLSFDDFSLEYYPDPYDYYRINPNETFTVEDTVKFELSSSEFYSLPLIIIFKMDLSNHNKYISYTIPEDTGSLTITADNINNLPLSLSTEPISVTEKVDVNSSTISPSSQSSIVFKDSTFFLNLNLIDINGDPLSNGYYEFDITSEKE